jgi:hypothetical protein
MSIVEPEIEVVPRLRLHDAAEYPAVGAVRRERIVFFFVVNCRAADGVSISELPYTVYERVSHSVN